MASVVTSIAFVLDDLLTKIKLVDTNLKHVYDEQLSVETGINRFREANQIESLIQEALPLFIFKRNILQPTAMGRRSGRYQVLEQKNTTFDNGVDSYYNFIGKIVIDFIYVSTNMQDIDNFEVLYAMEQSINSVKSVQMNVNIIGQWQYSCFWSELSDISVQVDGLYYKGLNGQVEIKGPFLAFNIREKYIATINKTVKSVSQSVSFSSITVP